MLKERAPRTDSEWASIGEEQFRDSIATVDTSGKRVWIFPKKPSGTFHRWRIAVTVVLLTLLFIGPFLKLNGQPFLLLNFFERRFIIFGHAFWPQDFFLLAILLITFFVFIILFTVVFGRVWCGWMCPQTLFMEMVFRKIEYWIEGDAPAQRRLEKGPWTVARISKKAAKQILFAIVSVLISFTFMSYLTGVESSIDLVGHPADHAGGFIALVAFTGIFHFNFARFREQACIAVCPYGRLQGVLLSKASIVIAYDWIRGEPRKHLKRHPEVASNAGHCIDCKLCVHVCPTGIDIRNGTQMECVNCTACIDVCDEVMVKIGKPTGLIRYASHNSIRDGVSRIFSVRVMGYSVVLGILLSILGFALITRSDIETTVLKVPGTLYQRENSFITNLYNVEFVNKTFDEMQLEIRIESPPTAQIIKADRRPIVVPASGLIKGVYFIRMPEENVTSPGTTVTIGVYSHGRKIEDVSVRFIGPVSSTPDAGGEN